MQLRKNCCKSNTCPPATLVWYFTNCAYWSTIGVTLVIRPWVRFPMGSHPGYLNPTSAVLYMQDCTSVPSFGVDVKPSVPCAGRVNYTLCT